MPFGSSLSLAAVSSLRGSRHISSDMPDKCMPTLLLKRDYSTVVLGLYILRMTMGHKVAAHKDETESLEGCRRGTWVFVRGLITNN